MSERNILRAVVEAAGLEVCSTPDHEVWGLASINGSASALPLMAPELGDWMAAAFQRSEGKVPSRESMREVLASLRGAAMTSPASVAQSALITQAQQVQRTQRGPADPSQADLLVEMVLDVPAAELFHAPDRLTTYAQVSVAGIRQTLALRSRAFRAWMSSLFYAEHAKTPRTQSLQEAIGTLEGQALFAGPSREVFVRVAAPEPGVLWLDLGGGDHAAVRVTRAGWRVVEAEAVEVPFYRPGTLRPLPRPVPGGTIAGVTKVMNLPEGGDQRLAVGWVLGALAPDGPFLVAEVVGQQGAAKTFTCRVLRRWIDPAEPLLRGRPRNTQDVIVAARANRVVAFDNFSSIDQDLSDELARLATGAGFGARTLYTDIDETTFSGARPIVLNGIGSPVESSDLLDRCVVLDLPRIEEGSYRAEEDLWADFEAAWPEALGALLDGAARALSDGASTAAPAGRMVDAARWVTAAAPVLGWPATGEGSFAAAYKANRAQADASAVESSVIGDYVKRLAEEGFEGSASEVLARLDRLGTDTERRARAWPKTAAATGKLLHRVAPNLRRLGYVVERGRVSGGGRVWTLGRQPG